VAIERETTKRRTLPASIVLAFVIGLIAGGSPYSSRREARISRDRRRSWEP